MYNYRWVTFSIAQSVESKTATCHHDAIDRKQNSNMPSRRKASLRSKSEISQENNTNCLSIIWSRAYIPVKPQFGEMVHSNQKKWSADGADSAIEALWTTAESWHSTNGRAKKGIECIKQPVQVN